MLWIYPGIHDMQVLVKLLDKFDPKTDGADRSYADIYEEPPISFHDQICDADSQYVKHLRVVNHADTRWFEINAL